MALVTAPSKAPRWLTNAEPGSKLFVLYDRQEALWHERLLCAPVADWCWVVTTPTLDQHEEDFGYVMEIIQCGPKRGVPRELYAKKQLCAKKLFCFDGLSAAQVKTYIKSDDGLAGARVDD